MRSLLFLLAIGLTASALFLTKPKPVQKLNLGATLCDTCKDFAVELTADVDEYGPQAEASVVALCAKYLAINQNWEQQCETYVKTNFDAIIQAVDQNVTAQGLCNEFLHIC